MSGETVSKWQERLRTMLDGKHRYRWIIAIGLCGMVLIALSSLLGGGGEETPTASTPSDTAAYAAALEVRLAEMVSSIDGAGAAKVMVTLENGVEYIYASEEKSNSDHTENGAQVSVSDDSQKTVVTIDAGSGKEGLLVTEIQPTVRGVVVACEGATDPQVTALVTAAVRTALDITEKRVCVIPYSTERE